jgi:hypothetical protein
MNNGDFAGNDFNNTNNSIIGATNNSPTVNNFNMEFGLIGHKISGIGVIEKVLGGNVAGHSSGNIGVVGTSSSNSINGSISNSAVAQAGSTASNNHGSTGKESELIRIFRLLDVRGRNKILSAAFSLEEEMSQAGGDSNG